MILFLLCVALLTGIVLGDRLAVPASATGSAAAGVIALALIWWPRRELRLTLLLSAALLLGMARLALAQPSLSQNHVWTYLDQQVQLEGVIAQQPERFEERQRAVLAVERVMHAAQPRVAEGLVLLRLPPTPELAYGQRVRVQGRLELPRSNGDFDYRAYLARRRIYVVMSQPELTVLSGHGGWNWQRALLQLNQRAQQVIQRSLPEPHAALLIGILLGVQSTLPAETREAFTATGLTHILVISGWNITVIIVGVSSLLAALGLGRKQAAAASLPVIALYVCFIGFSPSVARAALMGSLVVLATLVDRESEAWTSLAVACAGMAVWDPLLLWEIGFQLSALATAGLFAFARPLDRRLARLPLLRWRGLRWAIEPLTATLAASALTLPIIVYHFGRLSLIAPLANVLILPVVPYAMLCGALATLAGLLWLPLGEALALLVWPLLDWMIGMARLLAGMPGASATLPPFGAGWVWGYYALALAGWWWRRRRAPRALRGDTAVGPLTGCA
ncbi:ComEC/Rec2 family competence protein [Kallotenue papyrolyticum]|uniref:ComEC/Rec2 family competence protein n=1 Tax=Kallotenue papyrolyticum TaxID=1325125 RepID=UPI0004785359|nr:ComEC/Rec2 family competence protein [Kallotenue papyrolyticum]